MRGTLLSAARAQGQKDIEELLLSQGARVPIYEVDEFLRNQRIKADQRYGQYVRGREARVMICDETAIYLTKDDDIVNVIPNDKDLYSHEIMREYLNDLSPRDEYIILAVFDGVNTIIEQLIDELLLYSRIIRHSIDTSRYTVRLPVD